MCKMMIFTNLSKVKHINKLTETIAHLVGETEVDGYGYAIQGVTNTFGERTTLSPQMFKVQIDKPLFDVKWVRQHFNRFGVKEKAKGAGLFHGRTSTNMKGLINTHPIVKSDWTLVHNGVVSNQGPEYKMVTDNDTEHVLHYMSTVGISGVEKHLTGYYAFAAFDPEGRLHVVKDATASLYVAHIPKLNSLVFSTKMNHISEVCDEMDWEHSVVSEMVDNTYLIFKDNKIVHESTIAPRGRTHYEDSFASKSLGYELRSDKYDYTEDELSFLEEVKGHADHTYKIFDYRGSEVSWDEFILLEDDDKLMCTIVRPDGTVCDPANYNEEKLYEGIGA